MNSRVYKISRDYTGVFGLTRVGFLGREYYHEILQVHRPPIGDWFYGEPSTHGCCDTCRSKLRKTTIIKIALRGWIYRFRRRKAAAKVIQTAFREAYYNPSYTLCQRVLERSYNSFNQHC